MKKTIIAVAVSALMILGAPSLAHAAEACEPKDAVTVEHEAEYGDPPLITPAVEEVSHLDYEYLPYSGSVAHWSHKDNGKTLIYDWTLYYRTGVTQKHVEVEAQDAVYGDAPLIKEAWTETISEAVTCPPPVTETEDNNLVKHGSPDKGKTAIGTPVGPDDSSRGDRKELAETGMEPWMLPVGIGGILILGLGAWLLVAGGKRREETL